MQSNSSLFRLKVGVQVFIMLAKIYYLRRTENEQEEYDDTVMYIDTDIRCLENIVASEYQVQAIWQKLTSSEREIMYFWAIEGYSTSELAEMSNWII